MSVLKARLWLLLLTGCGMADGYSYTARSIDYQFLFFGNYGSSTLAPFYLRSDGHLTRAANTIPTGSGTSSVNSLTLSPNKKYLYGTNRNTNNIAAYTISDMTSRAPGSLSALSGSFAFAATAAPTSFSILSDGRFAYVTNSTAAGNNISIYSTSSESGSLTAVGTAAAKTNPISSAVSLDNRFLYVANRGTSDISVYAIDSSTGALSTINLSVAACVHPEFILVDPSGKFVYAVCSTQNAIAAFSIGASGDLTATSPAHFSTDAVPLRIAITPEGKFIYAANTVGNTISAFAIDANLGTLSEVPGQPFALPSNFGSYALNASPDGKFLVVTGSGTDSAQVYGIESSGALTRKGLPVNVGTLPRSVAFINLKRVE